MYFKAVHIRIGVCGVGKMKYKKHHCPQGRSGEEHISPVSVIYIRWRKRNITIYSVDQVKNSDNRCTLHMSDKGSKGSLSCVHEVKYTHHHFPQWLLDERWSGTVGRWKHHCLQCTSGAEYISRLSVVHIRRRTKGITLQCTWSEVSTASLSTVHIRWRMEWDGWKMKASLSTRWIRWCYWENCCL